ncbi:MAG: hypothetical protein C4297_03265 [Gemmataceae bacterium]
MMRKSSVLLAVLVCIAALASYSVAQRNGGPNAWASKARLPQAPVAVLIELGITDREPTDWSATVQVEGARIVRREGYHFRAKDRLVEPDGWQAQSRRPPGVPARQPPLARTEGIQPTGVVLHLADVTDAARLTVRAAGMEATVPLEPLRRGQAVKLWNGRAQVRRLSTTEAIASGASEEDHPAACYGPDGTLWVAWIAYRLKVPERKVRQGQLEKVPDSFADLYRPEMGDQLLVRCYRDGRWSQPIAVTSGAEDLARCALAAQKDGIVWAIYSAVRQGQYRVMARPLRLAAAAEGANEIAVGSEQEWSRGTGPHLSPCAVTSADGQVFATWQALAATPNGAIVVLGPNEEHTAVLAPAPGPSGHPWHPMLAAVDRRLFVVFDQYRQGDYDVLLADLSLDRSGSAGKTTVRPLAASSRFEARPSICADADGRLWVAYEEGPIKWGKDYGAFDSEDGNPLYNERHIRIVCVEPDGTLKEPVASLPMSRFDPPKMDSAPNRARQFETTPRYAYPRIGIDGRGHLWLVYRQKFGTRYSTSCGSYWMSFARRLEGDHWSEAIELHHADGLLDHRPVLLPHPGGGLLVIHSGDGRYTTPDRVDTDLYMSVVDLPGSPGKPVLRAFAGEDKRPETVAAQKQEEAAVAAMRQYRIDQGSQKLRLLRGEFHRHTEISWDGGPDGSLEDMFRYALDAAALDWIGNGDHDNGGGREYTWWLTQKWSDAYRVAGRFVPMFSYERSVPFPHGHRNVVFAKRGVLTLPRLAEPDPDKRVAGIHADDTKMLYAYLRALDGVCASHTSATGMGTDWRDNDPRVEPFVEIYQGDRMSYEYLGCPRGGYDPKSGKKPAQIGGWQPEGFVDLALKKGYRLGFQASSDHWSTHISYCVVLAPELDRQAILEAMKKRHVYGATDNIVLDVRCGQAIMGDVVTLHKPPTLTVYVRGTAPLDKVEILKDSKPVHSFQPLAGEEFRGQWTDDTSDTADHYYYVRVQQKDGELAWSSPIWVQRP